MNNEVGPSSSGIRANWQQILSVNPECQVWPFSCSVLSGPSRRAWFSYFSYQNLTIVSVEKPFLLFISVSPAANKAWNVLEARSLFCPHCSKEQPSWIFGTCLDPREETVPEKSKACSSATLSRGSAPPWSKEIFLGHKDVHSFPSLLLLCFKEFPVSPLSATEKSDCPWPPGPTHLHHSAARNRNHTG